MKTFKVTHYVGEKYTVVLSAEDVDKLMELYESGKYFQNMAGDFEQEEFDYYETEEITESTESTESSDPANSVYLAKFFPR